MELELETGTMRLLITGGSGFLGSHILRLAKGQHEPFATFFSRPCEHGVQLDVRDAEAVQAVFARIKPDVVIHTAYDKARRDVIVAGSENIAHVAQQHNARLIHLSSDAIFSGRHVVQRAYCEEDVPDPVTEYGQMKAEAEQVVKTHAPNATLVRTSLIYGTDANNRQDAHTQFVLDGLRANRPITLFTDEYRCPIFVEDLAQALRELIDMGSGDFNRSEPTTKVVTTPLRGILHIAGVERVSRYEFGVAIARYHGYTDLTNLVATTTAATGMVRPKDCTLNSERARGMLRTRLRGVSEVLQH
jgi:dTDP-4-dehydrorhamnose reductase